MSSALADTSVVIDWDLPGVAAALPDDVVVSTMTLAELAAGPHLAQDPLEKALRQARLQQVESLFEPLEFDVAASRSFGLIVSTVVSAGRSPRSGIVDLLIAAVAHANQLPLYTRNPRDFAGLGALVTVVAV